MMFAVFVYQFIMDRFDLTRRRQKIVMAGLFGMAEIMTMTFPFNVTTGVFVDLRDVPVVLSTLYGGPGVGGFVVIAFAVNRLLRGGGGMLSAFISVPALFLTAVLIRSWYKRSPRLTKIVAVMAIVSVPAVTVLLMSHFVVHYSRHTLVTILQSFFMRSLTLAMTAYSMEMLLENARIRNQVHRSEKLHVVGELAASVAHEIRNPLTVIKGFVQLISETQRLDDKGRMYIAVVADEADRAESIIVDYLTFAKPQPTSQVFDLSTVITHVVDILRPFSTMQSVTLSCEFMQSLMVRGDSDKFMQSIINIVKNGIESMPGGGVLQIHVKQVKSSVLVEIVDQGTGMDDSALRRLGTPFYSTKTSGTGLGLMMTYHTMQVMGGDVHVESYKGKGTKFRIILPMVSVRSPSGNPHEARSGAGRVSDGEIEDVSTPCAVGPNG